jgi:DNA-directed RNA polymerase specialized sigma24 family protein
MNKLYTLFENLHRPALCSASDPMATIAFLLVWRRQSRHERMQANRVYILSEQYEWCRLPVRRQNRIVPTCGAESELRSKALLCLNAEQYGNAYARGFASTTRFLISRGCPFDLAQELGQAAWVRGWEHRSQLHEPSKLVTWVNTIALNLYRTSCRRECRDVLIELSEMPRLDGYLDAQTLLRGLKFAERRQLEELYLEGRAFKEVAEREKVSEVALRVRVCRIKQRLRRQVCAPPEAKRGA